MEQFYFFKICKYCGTEGVVIGDCGSMHSILNIWLSKFENLVGAHAYIHLT